MAKVYITEYARQALDARGLVMAPEEPPLATQVLDTTAGVQQSAAFNAETRFVRIHTDGIISYLFGTNPTATTGNARMAANQTEYFGTIRGGTHKVSAITNT